MYDSVALRDTMRIMYPTSPTTNDALRESKYTDICVLSETASQRTCRDNLGFRSGLRRSRRYR